MAINLLPNAIYLDATGSGSQVYRISSRLILAVLLGASADVRAHVSESGYVLLLPTNMYISSGLIAVAATMVLVSILPATVTSYWSTPIRLPIPRSNTDMNHTTGFISFTALLLLLYAGYFGNPDPLRNALPLFFWTVFWVGLTLVQGVIGDVWQRINPWAGLHQLFYKTDRPYYQLPESVGVWPAGFLFLCFFTFYLADLAPDNPNRLATALTIYSVITITGLFVFGRQSWLSQCEFFTVFMRLLSLLAPVGRHREKLCIGYPGWKLLRNKTPSISLGIFCLLTLGSGSFDGINETFWWLHLNGINPLAYQGRSSTALNNVAGLLAFNLMLIVSFALCVKAGRTLVCRWGDNAADQKVTFIIQLSCLAMAVLPIAFAYHYAHFLTMLMVNIQYVAQLIIHPVQIARDYLDPVSIAAAHPHHVSAGFLANHETVKIIWLSQCVAVVTGHVLSAMLTHAIASTFYSSRRNTVLIQLPIAAFMLMYTYLGLWLLSSARL
ncbi:MAG: hypothetical protein AB8B97_08870 [Granulosicoccus sp.]